MNRWRARFERDQLVMLAAELRHVTSIGERQSIHDETVLTYLDSLLNEA